MPFSSHPNLLSKTVDFIDDCVITTAIFENGTIIHYNNACVINKIRYFEQVVLDRLEPSKAWRLEEGAQTTIQ